uniref:Uncharacterized protein n=1 Tax=Cacopsylla melanoneura TaxID=428564 RepID=A0A8D9BSQ1_9HEMI
MPGNRSNPVDVGMSTSFIRILDPIARRIFSNLCIFLSHFSFSFSNLCFSRSIFCISLSIHAIFCVHLSPRGLLTRYVLCSDLEYKCSGSHLEGPWFDARS